jgi:aquaporin Z
MAESTDAPATTEAPTLAARLAAEAIGTFILVFGVIGTALFAAGFRVGVGNLNVGFLGVALAIGIAVLVAAYAFGPISGGHFNPAVTLGLAAANRFAWRDVIGYIIAQLVGGIVASTLLLAIAAGGKKGYTPALFQGASNGWDKLSPGGYSFGSAALVEVILTAVFVYVIIGVTSRRAAAGFGPLAIGLTLTVIHLISIPVDNTSVNPARSIATAIYGGGDAMGQLWLFIVAPIVGALLAGFTFRFLFDGTKRS